MSVPASILEKLYWKMHNYRHRNFQKTKWLNGSGFYDTETTQRWPNNLRGARRDWKGLAVRSRKSRNRQLSRSGSTGLFYFLANGPVSGRVVKFRNCYEIQADRRKPVEPSPLTPSFIKTYKHISSFFSISLKLIQ